MCDAKLVPWESCATTGRGLWPLGSAATTGGATTGGRLWGGLEVGVEGLAGGGDIGGGEAVGGDGLEEAVFEAGGELHDLEGLAGLDELGVDGHDGVAGR